MRWLLSFVSLINSLVYHSSYTARLSKSKVHQLAVLKLGLLGSYYVIWVLKLLKLEKGLDAAYKTVEKRVCSNQMLTWRRNHLDFWIWHFMSLNWISELGFFFVTWISKLLLAAYASTWHVTSVSDDLSIFGFRRFCRGRSIKWQELFFFSFR